MQGRRHDNGARNGTAHVQRLKRHVEDMPLQIVVVFQFVFQLFGVGSQVGLTCLITCHDGVVD